MKDIFELFRELPGKTEFNRYLELLIIYLGSNIRDVQPAQIRDAIDEVLEEGGAMMSTVFQQIKEEGIEIGVMEGEEIGIKKGEEKNKLKIAINCLLKGMDTWTIAEITELPIERIDALKAAIHQGNPVHR